MRAAGDVPELAAPNDGVGLAREEFIVTSYIKVHPLALVNYPDLQDAAVKAQTDAITTGYGPEDKPQFFVDWPRARRTVAVAFYPKDVMLRLTDFKTNEYAGLVGGRPYEPVEENPMIGFRGDSRYYDRRHQAGFALECRR